MDKTQPAAGDNKLTATTMELSNNASNRIYKDTESIDHLNKNKLNVNKNTTKRSTTNEWPTPRTTKSPPLPISDLNSTTCEKMNKPINMNNYNLLSLENNTNRNNLNELATTENKSSSSIANLTSSSSSASEREKRNLANKKINLLEKSESKASLRLESGLRSSSLKSDNCSRKSFRNELKFNNLKSNFKEKLSDMKSDLNDLSDLLNLQTTTAASAATTSSSIPINNNSNIKLMSFVVQPKSVNTDIDSRLMDHILAKICAQRDNNQSSNNTKNSDSSNIPSTSKAKTSVTKTTIDEQQQTKKMSKRIAVQKLDSKLCQTDKIQNQDASVSVDENDLKGEESEKDTRMINSRSSNSGNDEKNKKKENKSDSSKEKGDSELCEDCKKRCDSKQQLIDCTISRQFNRQESLNHCCIKGAQEQTCATIFHHNHPVCINTFNHNTFTSLPNLTHHHSPTIEKGTNTEPEINSELENEAQSSKKDKQTQCILGLSLEQQQREYIEQQQQKYLKLKNEQLKQNRLDDDGDKSKKLISNSDLGLPKESESDDKVIEKVKEDKEIEKSVRKEEIDKEKVLNEKREIQKRQTTTFAKDENSIPNNLESTDLSDEKRSLDLTIPVSQIKFPFSTNKIERKLIDLSKEKNVKTHSKIIIEFSGKSKRERSAVDSFTKLDKDGRLTKKTLVSNTKEINVPVKLAKDKREETISNNLNVYPLSSTPQQQNNQNNYSLPTPAESNSQQQQLINQNKLYLNKNASNNENANDNNQWKEASHSEITNELSADPLLDENNQAHPTKSITLSTITTFDQAGLGETQRIDHSNKYKRCFENPQIHEPLIESNLTILDEPNLSSSGQETTFNLSSNQNSSSENLAEEPLNAKESDKIMNREMNNLSTTLNNRKSQVSSSNESRSTESRLSNSSQSRESEPVRNEEIEANLNSRSASRVSFNLPEHYRDNLDEESTPSQSQILINKNNHFNQPNNYHSTLLESVHSNLDQIENLNKEEEKTNLDNIRLAKKASSRLVSEQSPPGLLETELDDHLFLDDDGNEEDNFNINNLNPQQQQQSNLQYKDEKTPKTAKPSKSKERKSSSKSSKRRHHQQPTTSADLISDQSSSYSAVQQAVVPKIRSTSSKQLNDSGFLSPEIYHSSPYELAYKQVNGDEEAKSNERKVNDRKSKSDRKKSTSSSPDKKVDQKKSKHKNLLKNNDGLQFTEHSSNTEIITRLTKTSYPFNYSQSNVNKIDQSEETRMIEKSLKQLKRNKMVLDQILNSPDIKSSSSKSSGTKKSSRDKKKKSGCKISSQITMDLPIYKEEKSIQKTSKTVSNSPVKSLSLEELDKERDLDRKSIVSQHSYSQKSGEFNTMTKFQRYKPSSKSSKKNKSALQLNQPNKTEWEYTSQCNCVNGSKANVL